MAQGNHTSARQRGNVNHCSWFEPFCIGQSIAKYQATLCIGVQYFDGLAAHAGHHITWLEGFTTGHVFAGRNQSHHIDGGL